MHSGRVLFFLGSVEEVGGAGHSCALMRFALKSKRVRAALTFASRIHARRYATGGCTVLSKTTTTSKRVVSATALQHDVTE